ncbi:hypothetical protein OPV22_020161 [Ensete ventricosum]|uniref:Uncharacterized protein n=1 Tax=Ensete ventricosum TaxID=4639 RepID=A0AAV8Q9K2_ENSVE|nr:hypothetical protein OPV22_020161 [Ensete ventricosum]
MSSHRSPLPFFFFENSGPSLRWRSHETRRVVLSRPSRSRGEAGGCGAVGFRMEERPRSFTLRGGSVVLGFVVGEKLGFRLSSKLLFVELATGWTVDGKMFVAIRCPSEDDDALLTEWEATDAAVSDSRDAQTPRRPEIGGSGAQRPLPLIRMSSTKLLST